jgi:hypothetical protein
LQNHFGHDPLAPKTGGGKKKKKKKGKSAPRDEDARAYYSLLLDKKMDHSSKYAAPEYTASPAPSALPLPRFAAPAESPRLPQGTHEPASPSLDALSAGLAQLLGVHCS